MRIHRIIVGAVLLLWCRAAFGQSGTCTPITSVTTTITTSGVYCLTGNLTYNSNSQGNAITVDINAVVIDFNGYRLLDTGSSGNSTGVMVNESKNVTIRNGLISDFYTAIFSYARATIVEDMRFSNVGNGVNIYGVSGAIIRRNHFRDNATSISVSGDSARIVDNDIVGSLPNLPYQTGIRITGLIGGGQDAIVVRNRLSRCYFGILYSSGATGKYRDNLTADVTIPFTGGTDAGNNN